MWRPLMGNRAFAVARVPIDHSNLKLNVEIAAPKEMKPAQSMPIAVRVVSEQAFTAWVTDAQKKFANNETPTDQVASAGTTGR